jgi:hypothetical protein
MKAHKPIRSPLEARIRYHLLSVQAKPQRLQELAAILLL